MYDNGNRVDAELNVHSTKNVTCVRYGQIHKEVLQRKYVGLLIHYIHSRDSVYSCIPGLVFLCDEGALSVDRGAYSSQ